MKREKIKTNEELSVVYLWIFVKETEFVFIALDIKQSELLTIVDETGVIREEKKGT